MGPNWIASVDAQTGGRCYLSRNSYLIQWLTATGRLRPAETPDVLYAQVGYDPPPNLGQRLTVVQSVTYVSEAVAKIEAVAAGELEITRICCAAADLVVAHSPVQARALEAIGVEAGKIAEVRPASAIRAPHCGKSPLPRVVGYAGQDLPRKRKEWARMAAEAAGAPLCATNSTRFGAMGAWYASVGLVAVPSTGESWGMVVSEAIAHGVPAVVTDEVGASAEIIETGAGLVAKSDDPDEFSDAVGRVLDEHERFARLARGAPCRRLSQWARDLVSVVEERL